MCMGAGGVGQGLVRHLTPFRGAKKRQAPFPRGEKASRAGLPFSGEKASRAGFEPTRAVPNGFQVHRLNLSANVTLNTIYALEVEL